jgi:hypothetical protein
VKYLPTSDADRAQMLASIGVSSVDQEPGLRDILPSDDRLPA